jgi:hypothetical protein
MTADTTNTPRGPFETEPRPAMTARKSSAEDRIMQAHVRLLASTRITPDMPDAVRDALIRKCDFIESSVLACLIGRLSGTVSDRKPVSPTRLAEMVEAMCAEGEKHAARVIAAATPKETGQ